MTNNKLQNYNFRSQEKPVRTIVYGLKFCRNNAAQICMSCITTVEEKHLRDSSKCNTNIGLK